MKEPKAQKDSELFIIDENDENNIKKGRAKKIILTLLVFLLLGIVFNIFTAFFPIPPFVLENTEDLKPVKYGLPFGAIELTPDSESIQQLESAGIYKSFIIPRYDKYQINIVVWKLICNIAIASAVIAGIYFLFKYLKYFAKRILLFLALGFVLTLISAFTPVPPGTFTIDDLEPMKFGFVVKFVEQTPNMPVITTWDMADEYLAQAYIAPNYIAYTTHIVAWKALICILLNSLIIACVFYIIKWLKYLIFGGPKKVRQKYREENIKIKK